MSLGQKIYNLVFVQNRHNWALLTKFAIVGGSGVVINMGVMILLDVVGPPTEAAVWAIPGTPFNVRWYHVFSVTAFLIANLWNFQLNRSWTFGSAGRTPWWGEYRAFLTVGAIGQGIGLALLTLLMHQDSPLALSPTFFNDSSLLLTRVYWAQLIMIAVVTPVTFLLNKLWTFQAMRAPRSVSNPR